MRSETAIFRSRFPVSAEELFDWHRRPGAFERLRPPWERVEVIERHGGIEDGGRVVIRLALFGPVGKLWEAEHRDFVEGRQFRDVQVRGPFASWVHTHRVEPDGPGHAWLEDRIDYALPLRSLGRWLAGGHVRHTLSRSFAYRHAVTRNDLLLHASRPDRKPGKILVTGAGGLIGSNLVPFLTTGGHAVWRLARDGQPAGPYALTWDQLATHPQLFEGFDAVVHLAGEPVAGRWTAAKKERIRASRVEGTRRLCEALARLRTPPRVLLSASAVGYYGDRGDETLDEASPAGTGFLADVCRDWEAATEPAAQAGIRVAQLRFGVVLSPAGGALAPMLTPFRLGLGGRIGDGRHWTPWVALDDALGAIHHALFHETLSGPVNVVAPRPVTNAELTRTLGRVLSRPTFVPLPAFAARLAFGELTDEAILASADVRPRRLHEAGYPFLYPELNAALRHQLGKNEFEETGDVTRQSAPDTAG